MAAGFKKLGWGGKFLLSCFDAKGEEIVYTYIKGQLKGQVFKDGDIYTLRGDSIFYEELASAWTDTIFEKTELITDVTDKKEIEMLIQDTLPLMRKNFVRYVIDNTRPDWVDSEDRQDLINKYDIDDFYTQITKTKVWTDAMITKNSSIIATYNVLCSVNGYDVHDGTIEIEAEEGFDFNDENLPFLQEFELLEKEAWKSVTPQKYWKYIDAMDLTALKMNLKDALGNPFIPKGRQSEVLLFMGRFNYFVTCRGAGKCVSEDAEIRMFDGTFKKAKDIVDGELLLASDKKSFVTVHGLERFKKKSTKVTLADGSSFIVSDDHRVPTQHTFKEGKRDMDFDNYKIASELTTGDFIPKLLKTNINEGVGSYEEGAVVGYALGDGCLTNGAFYISSFNDVISNRIIQYANKLGYESTYNESSNMVGIRNAKQLRDKYGLYGKTIDKYISQNIFSSSSEFKRGVVEGLIGSDGYLSFRTHKKGNNRKDRCGIEFSSINEKLVIDFQKLLLDLGVISYIRKYNKNTKCLGREYNLDVYYLSISDIESIKLVLNNTDLNGKKNHNEVFNLINNISGYSNGHLSTIPLSAFEERTTKGIGSNTTYNGVRKPRYNFQRWKCENYGIQQWLEYSWSKVVKVESVGEQKVVDIEVDGDHLYWYDNILTHNTFVISYLVRRQLFLPNQLIGVLLPDKNNYARPLFRFIKPSLKGIEGFKASMAGSNVSIKNEILDSEVIFFPGNKDPDSSRGNTLDMLIIEEADFVISKAVEAAKPSISRANMGTLFAITTVGNEKRSWFYQDLITTELQMRMGDKRYFAKRVTIHNNPFILPEERDRLINIERPKDPTTFDREWMCSFSTEDSFDTSNFWIIDSEPYQISTPDGFIFNLASEMKDPGIGFFSHYFLAYDIAKNAHKPGVVLFGAHPDGSVHLVCAQYLSGGYFVQADYIKFLYNFITRNGTRENLMVGIDYNGVGIAVSEILESFAGIPHIKMENGGDKTAKDQFVEGKFKFSKSRFANKLKGWMLAGIIKGRSYMFELMSEIEGYEGDDSATGKTSGGSMHHFDILNALIMGSGYVAILGMFRKVEKGIMREATEMLYGDMDGALPQNIDRRINERESMEEDNYGYVPRR